MLACVQHQHQSLHHLPCVTQIPDTSVHQQTEPSARYPSTTELDAYAQKTADSPLSIKIFPSNIRVPQHKQINRTVNGLDTSGQRFSPYSQPFSAGHQGLLAIVKTPNTVKGLLKSSEGRRCKLSPIQMAVAPYMPPSNRHRQKSYDAGPDVPVHSITHHVSRPSNCSPAFLAATAASCSDSGSSRGGRVYAGAVLPTQSADVASGYVDGLDFWQHGAQRHLTQVYGGVISRSPEERVPVRSTRPSYTHHDLTVRSSPLNCTATHADFSTGQFAVPPWNGVLSTLDTESYINQHLHPHTRGRPQLYPSSCQTSVLSSSLKSLECLISEIHPPCIKEQMLGRAYAHVHLPVFR